MRSKTVADLGSSESFFKEDEAFSAEAASKTLKRLSDVELGKSDNMTQFCRSSPNHPMPVLFVHHTSSPTSLLLPYSPYRHLTTSSTVL